MIKAKEMKKILALLLIVLMLISTAPLELALATGDNSPEKQESAEVPEEAVPVWITVITGTTGMVAPMVEAYHNLTGNQSEPYSIILKIYSPGDLEISDRRDIVEDSILQSDVVLLEMVGANRDEKLNEIFSKLDPAQQPEIFVQRSGEKAADGTWATSGFLVNIVKDLEITVNNDDDVWTRLNRYITNGGVKNHERMLLYLSSVFGNAVTDEDLSPVLIQGNFIYHPAADSSSPFYEEGLTENTTGIFYDADEYFDWYESRAGFNPDAPWIGIMGYDSFFKNADIELYNDTLLALENRGLNAIPVYPTTTGRNAAARKFYFRDLDGDGVKEPAIHTFILCIGFQFQSGNEQATLDLFKEMNVPVLNPIYSSDLEKWEADPAGAISVVHWQVAMPEMEGRIEPVMMGGTVVKEVDEATGAVVTTKITLPDRLDRLVGRAAAWAWLKKTENSDKKIAVLYYNMEGGKDDIGASYLNVPRSLTEILKTLQSSGYWVNGNGDLNGSAGVITEEKIFDIMFQKGRNIGGWAPGELDRFASQEGIIKLDVDEYLQWFGQLPLALQEQVKAEWGPAPGSVMVHNGQIILPGYISGNVFFGPQPMRGWGEDINKIIHSPHMPPHHQYLAFYFWLQREFSANAVIHLGTHGTAEWLPGKSIGLSAECWPDVVHGHMPNIYPYIVNNPGEGTQAKRRGYAVLISHLTAAVANTELYGNLLDLHNLIHQCEDAMANHPGDTDTIDRITARMMWILDDEGVAGEIGLDPHETPFAELLDAVHDYLHLLEATVTPLGLHTFGVAPQGDRFDQMVDAIVNYDPETREAVRNLIADNLAGTTEEMDMLLLALDAGFIPPGLGRDPIRNPDAMPTGKNIKSFDPRTVPDKVAWNTGKELADKLLEAHFARHGSYPKSVGVILWAIETMRTDGESIAMTMRLMGIEPVWGASGRLSSYRITPIAELGRPRVDVVISTSGLFRDAFSVVNALLDKAVRELAMLNESPEDNYLKKHYDVIKAELMAEGMSETDASFLAASRVFSSEPGAYGLGLSSMMDFSDQWESTDALAELYVSRMGYIYGSDLADGSAVYGVPATHLLTKVLRTVEAVVQVKDSIYGTLDNDDAAQYLGGLKLAAEWASGNSVDAYIANSRLGPSNLFIQTLQEFVTMELQSRLLNPVFVQEMLKEGYSGARTIAKWFANTFYMDVTTGVISDRAWSQLVNTYIYDENVRNALDPFAMQSIIATALEAARKNLWAAPVDDITQLADIYLQATVEYGVVCCHHTCNNITLNEWIASFSMLDDSLLEQFKEIFRTATYNDLSINRPEHKDKDTEPLPQFPDKTPTENQHPEADEAIVTGTPPQADKLQIDVVLTGVPAKQEPSSSTYQKQPVVSAGIQPAPPVPGTQVDEPPVDETKPEEPQTPQNQVRAFELIKEKEGSDSPRSAGVAFISIILGLAMVGLMALGYLKKKKVTGI
ncbi:MAG: cobaltochelatase subunit CobN [Clostridiales bacterium]|jgi:cobaltochelatase CobN|nr:cobaltochelatase subunit CobN [Clostridiales bacterium]